MIMFVVVPKPGVLPAATSWAVGSHVPIITEWAEGLREGERGGEKESEVRSENDSEEEKTYLVAPGAHPEVHRCAEGEVGVLGDPLGLREEVHSEGPASWLVVVVPRELHWATPVVRLAARARAAGILAGGRARIAGGAVLGTIARLAADFFLPAEPPACIDREREREMHEVRSEDERDEEKTYL